MWLILNSLFVKMNLYEGPMFFFFFFQLERLLFKTPALINIIPVLTGLLTFFFFFQNSDEKLQKCKKMRKLSNTNQVRLLNISRPSTVA